MEEKKEKMDFFAREEIKTMAKDIARLREEEALAERERLKKLEVKESPKKAKENIKLTKEKNKKIPKPTERKRNEKPKNPNVPPSVNKTPEPLFKKQSSLLKVLVRMVFISIFCLFFALIIGFWYQYHQYLEVNRSRIIVSSNPPPKRNITPQEKVATTSKQEKQTPKKPKKVPSFLIPTNATTTIKIKNFNNLPKPLADTFKKDFPKGQLTGILVKDTTQDKFLKLSDFFDVFQITPPEGFYRRVDNNFTLFVYTPAKGRNSLGFVTKIKEKDGLKNSLRLWEKTMEKDFKKLSLCLGERKPAVSPIFTEKYYKEATFRYITLSPSPDYFGICYGIYKDYFIYSSSCHNTIKVIDLLSEKKE